MLLHITVTNIVVPFKMRYHRCSNFEYTWWASIKTEFVRLSQARAGPWLVDIIIIAFVRAPEAINN